MALVKYNNNSISAITTAGQLASGSMVLIKEQTASSSSSISFVHGSSSVVFDSTYPIYKFEFISIHPQTDNTEFQFNMSTDSGSNYNVTKTTTMFNANHNEAGSSTGLTYDTNADIAQGTGYKLLAGACGADADQAVSGNLFIFNPSSTTFVKHFLSTASGNHASDFAQNFFVAGYGNTTSAINAVRFQMDSGNIDSGTIKLYGIKDS